MRSGLIEYICIAPDHEWDGLVGVTVHQRCWAYCPSGGRTDHRWIRVGGVDLAEARSLTQHGDVAEEVDAV